MVLAIAAARPCVACASIWSSEKVRPRMSESPTSSSHPKRCRRLSKSSLDNLRSGAEAQMCSPQWLLGHKTEQDCALTHARSSVPVRVCLGQSRRRRSGPDCMCRRGRLYHTATASSRHAPTHIRPPNLETLHRVPVCGCSVFQRGSAFTLTSISARRTATGPVETHRGRRAATPASKSLIRAVCPTSDLPARRGVTCLAEPHQYSHS